MSIILRLFCLTIFMCLSHAVVASELPAKFIGKWSTEVIDQPGFPWWHQIKYPVEIVIENDSGYFIDQVGNCCDVENYFYDDEKDIIVLMHCFLSRSPNTVPSFFIISVEDEIMTGKVQSYQPLFQWRGTRVGE